MRGTSDPAFRRDFDATLFAPSGGADTDLHPEAVAGGPAQGRVVVLGAGPVTVDIRPGSYELLATRRPEHAVQRARVKVEAGQRQRVTFRLRRLIDPADALSADFHVHPGRSFDASAPCRAVTHRGRFIRFTAPATTRLTQTPAQDSRPTKPTAPPTPS